VTKEVELFFKEIVRLHGMPKNITLETIKSFLEDSFRRKSHASNHIYKEKENESGTLKLCVLGDQVLVHLRKYQFPTRTCNKLKCKNRGPCTILKKFSDISYQEELPKGMDISHLFNVVGIYMYPCIYV